MRKTLYLFESLWLANILDYVLLTCNHHVVSDSQFIATFMEGEFYGNLCACPCTWYWSMLSSTALVCIEDLTINIIVDLICFCWSVSYAEELMP